MTGFALVLHSVTGKPGGGDAVGPSFITSWQVQAALDDLRQRLFEYLDRSEDLAGRWPGPTGRFRTV